MSVYTDDHVPSIRSKYTKINNELSDYGYTDKDRSMEVRSQIKRKVPNSTKNLKKKEHPTYLNYTESAKIKNTPKRKPRPVSNNNSTKTKKSSASKISDYSYVQSRYAQRPTTAKSKPKIWKVSTTASLLPNNVASKRFKPVRPRSPKKILESSPSKQSLISRNTRKN